MTELASRGRLTRRPGTILDRARWVGGPSVLATRAERCEFPLNACPASSYPCFASGRCRSPTGWPPPRWWWRARECHLSSLP